MDDRQARRLAMAALARDDLELERFAHGWFVHRPDGGRGAAVIVVDEGREQVLALPSSLPRRVIEQRFGELRPRATVLSVPPDGDSARQ